MLRRIIVALVLCLLYIPAVYGNNRYQGWCEQGNAAVTVPGTAGSGTQRFQRSFASCTVTVYAAGTVTLSTIYSDNSNTARANPFTASSTGYWFFYASDGRYDVRFSGGGISTPFTLGDFVSFDPQAGSSMLLRGRGTLIAGNPSDPNCFQTLRLGVNAAQNVVFGLSNTWDIGWRNFANTADCSGITLETDDDLVIGSTDGCGDVSFYANGATSRVFQFNTFPQTNGTAARFRIETETYANLFNADPQINGEVGGISLGGVPGVNAFFISEHPAMTTTANQVFYTNWLTGGTLTIPAGTSALVVGTRIDTVTIAGAGAVTELYNLDVRDDPTGGGTNAGMRVRGTSVFDSLIKLAGVTSSFPALKRNSAALEVRAADDSAQAGLLALYGSFGTTPATSGEVRLPNNSAIVARNAANNANHILLALNTSDQLALGTSGVDIRWVPALVALGGGAAPSFGTIGGAGPGTAAQNSWMRVIDSLGAAFWVPVWK